MTYFFDGHARWSGPWESPNVFAATLVSLLPALWLLFFKLRSSRRLVLLILGIELVVYYALSKSASRGASVAFICTIFYWHIAFYKQRLLLTHFRAAASSILFRFVVFSIIATLSTFGHRISPQFIASDPSITNRIDLYLGAIKMIAASPLRGWGVGEGAACYGQWFQSPYDSVRHAGLISGPLEAAAEWGLPYFTIIATITVICLIMPFLSSSNSSESDRSYTTVLAAVIFTILVCNFFSPVAGDPAIAIIKVALLILVLKKFILANQSRLKILFISASIATSISLVLLFFGCYISHKDALRVKRLTNGNIQLEFNGKYEGRHTRLGIIPDPLILGEEYGKALRILLLNSKCSRKLMVYSPKQTANPEENEIIIAVGRTYTQVPGNVNCRIVLACPIASANDERPTKAEILLLPKFDFYGQNTFWREAILSNPKIRYVTIRPIRSLLTDIDAIVNQL
jgi:hypothetical protein